MSEKLETWEFGRTFVIVASVYSLEFSGLEWVYDILIQSNVTHKHLNTHLYRVLIMHGDPFVPRVGLAHSNDVRVNLNQINNSPQNNIY